MTSQPELPFWRRWFRSRTARGSRIDGGPAVVVYTSPTCPLCDDALEVIEAARRGRSFRLDVVDISGDPELQVLYGQEIPVVFVDGKKRFFGRVDPVLFRRLIER